MFTIGLTDHLEGPRDRRSSEIFDEVADLVTLADSLGVRYAWFSEHHAHAHQGHLPAPLLYALHLAGKTERIRLGTAILCLNLHSPLAIAEQVAVADTLTGGRMAVGFGSGSTPEEFGMFGFEVTDDHERHARFEEALRVIRAVWSGEWVGPKPRFFTEPPLRPPPIPSADLPGRCWLAVNSLDSARIAGAFGFNMLFSHLRTPEQYRHYRAGYAAAGGKGLVAANRPVFVGPDDARAFALAEPALRALWRRFRSEGKIPEDTPEPTGLEALSAHPINFLVGGPETVARQLRALRAEVPFDVANMEIRWAGLSHEQIRDSLRRLMEDVLPLLKDL
ncbi:MAG: hypothetical protein NVSMB9_37170 [Isosphaeraceae bacterium]